MDPEVTTFGVIQVGLTTADHVTDGVQAGKYLESGDDRWAGLTVALMFLPMATSCMIEIMNNILRYFHGRSDLVSWKQSLKRIASHFPLFQPMVHIWFFLKFRKSKGIMLKASKFYQSFKPEDVTSDNLFHHQIQVKKAAKDYAGARKALSSLKTEFQEMKLYEAFGEAAPQAVLQFSIMLQLGYITPLQCFTIATSVFSFSLNSANIFLEMKTKRKDIKEASAKALLFVFPMMFCIVIPRILSMSLVAGYSKECFPIFLVIMVGANAIVNFPHLRRDPGQAFLGVMTNTFAPCIIIEEGSGFFRRSGITSSVLHCLAQISLFCLVFYHVFEPCPDFDDRIYVPVSHCYIYNDTSQDLSKFGSMAISYSDSDVLNCKKNIIKSNISEPTNYDMIPILSREEGHPSFSVCFDIEWWMPLAIASGVLILFQLIGILIIALFLDRIIDPIFMFKISKFCFPTCLCEPIWDEENVDFFLKKETVDSFLKYPCQPLLKENNLFQISIENDFHEIINIALNKMENPIKIDKKLVDEAYLRGSVKTIKMLLRKIKETDDESHFDLEVLMKTLHSLRKQPKGFSKAVFSNKEHLFSLQKYSGLSSIEQRKHWSTLQLPMPNLLRIRINCSVVGNGMVNGENLIVIIFSPFLGSFLLIQNHK